MAATDRFYLWVGVNLTATSNTTFNGELDIEGTLNGNFDSTWSCRWVSCTDDYNSHSQRRRGWTSVVIAGTNFRTRRASSTVSFNGVNSRQQAWSATSILRRFQREQLQVPWW